MAQSVPISSFPNDFQVVLADWWADILDHELPTEVRTVRYELGQLRRDLSLETEHWNQGDFKRAHQMTEAIAQDAVFPPLIIRCAGTDPMGRILLDGYHRLFAMLAVGWQYHEAIEVN